MTLADWLWLSFPAIWIPMDVLIVKLWHGPTESEEASKYGQVSTAFSYSWGVLLGHWLLNSRHPIASAWGYAFAPASLLGSGDIVWNALKMPSMGWRKPLPYILFGLAAGCLFWGQMDPTAWIP